MRIRERRDQNIRQAPRSLFIRSLRLLAHECHMNVKRIHMTIDIPCLPLVWLLYRTSEKCQYGMPFMRCGAALYRTGKRQGNLSHGEAP